MADTAPAPVHPGLILGVARFYYDPRGSMRGVLDSAPGEARLLAYAMIAAAVLLAGRIMGLFMTPGIDLLPRVIEQIVSLLFFLPLAYYGLAALGTMIARTFKGEGSWYHGRAAFFWAALVSAPIVVLGNLFSAIMPDGPVGVAVSQIGPVFLAWALANCFAESFQFLRTLLVLSVIVAIMLIPLGLALLAKT